MLNDSDHDAYDLHGSNGQFLQAAFQMPQFMYNGPPTLAPGGGAEVLPLGGPSVWMENSGFSFSGARTMSYNIPDSTYRSSLQQALDYGDSPTTTTTTTTIASAPFDYDSLPVSPPLPAPSTASFFAPSPLGLPVYSTSGFDLLSVFGRVANRPNPQIKLGPVDLTSSFVVVDVRRYDHPIVYCSPTFCTLTGYEEREILGKNCRFLQAPPTVGVLKGDERKWTSAEAVKLIRKSLVASKEVQASLVNYKKDGSAFINLVTVIPVPEAGGSGEPLYHLGFQVDLTQQPAAILDRLKAGSYITSGPASDLHVIPKKPPPIPPIVASESLILPPTSEDSHPLSMAVLAASPDFFLVVSLKGLLLYVAPAVSHVLGYAPSDLVNKTLGDIAHTADVIPLMRELKDSSAPGEKPRPVDLLFRARRMGGGWVWLECRGRLHVEPGKGRKAIVLSARVKEVGSLRAPLVSGGVSGTVTPDGTILVATRDVAGWTVAELVGKSFYALFDTLSVLPDAKRALMRRKEGGKVEVDVRVWRQLGSDSLPRVYQITDAPSQPATLSFDVFEELGTERESSWQYELQQLRFKNQRLEEQIKGIEREARVVPSAHTHVHQDVYGEAVAAPWYGQSLKRGWDGIA